MFGGKLSRIETGRDIQDVLGSLKEGYVLLSWRDEDDIKRAFLFVRDGTVFGAFLESVLRDYSRSGEDAVPEIAEALSAGRVKTFEVYEADVGEILRENPGFRISSFPYASLKGENVDEVLELFRNHSGPLYVTSGNREWRLLLRGGRTLKAHLVGEGLLGDEAVLALLREMGHIIKEGTFRFISGNPEFPEGSGVSKHSESLLELGEVFSLKRKVDSGLTF